MSYQPVHGSGSTTPTPGGYYRDDPEGNNYDTTYRNNGGGGYPMSSGNPYAATSSEPRNVGGKKSSKKKWIIIGIIALICAIVAAVVGGVVGSRNAKNNDSKSASDKAAGGSAPDGVDAGPGGTGNGPNSGTDAKDNAATQTDSSGRPTALPAGLSYISQEKEYRVGSDGNVYLPLATDVNLLPAYATGTQTAGYGAPTVAADPGNNGAWPSDPDSPSTSSPRNHPRLIAPQYKWDALKNGMIAADPYLSFWNDTIVGNASRTLGDAGVRYVFDGGAGGSGVLDVAREIKLKIKNWAYAYKITGQDQYAARVWQELQHAANVNGDFGSGNDIWNCASHFLDCAEFTSAFAIAYDWLYDYFTAEQRTSIRGWIVTNGLSKAATPGWWSGETQLINGNWNCVSNAGLILGALAILGDDTTGTAANMISGRIDSAKKNCFMGAYSDGTWSESANYWYFGTTGAAEMASALQTAQGVDLGIDQINPGWKHTSLYHIYVQGMTSLYNYGDHGPNKFSSTANSLMYWGTMFNEPRFHLYQRDHFDASEPFSMFWYDPAVEGAWWNGLDIDKHFDAKEGEWATGRSSWSDNSGTFWAMKAGSLQNHQNHGDLDIGDFVFDAMGQRWAGDLGSDQYLGYQYFDGATASSGRWTYYRKRTEGQNTILIGKANQELSAAPVVGFGSSGTKQGNMPSLALGKDDTAYMTIDMSSAYKSGVTAKRGIRFLNGRKQLLLQDEVSGTGSDDIMWRVHTNASVAIDTAGTTATLTLSERTVRVQLLHAEPAGLKFTTMNAEPIGGVTPAQGGTADNVNQNMDNSGVTVLVIENAAGGSMHTEVLFTPQWPGLTDADYQTPPSVGIDSWSLDSHK